MDFWGFFAGGFAGGLLAFLIGYGALWWRLQALETRYTAFEGRIYGAKGNQVIAERKDAYRSVVLSVGQLLSSDEFKNLPENEKMGYLTNKIGAIAAQHPDVAMDLLSKGGLKL